MFRQKQEEEEKKEDPLDKDKTVTQGFPKYCHLI